MTINRLLLLAGLSILFAGCSTGMFTSGQQIDKNMYSYAGDSTAKEGVHYLFGRGVAQNDEKAFYYFQKAATAGDKYAMNEVAYLYAAGKGTRPDQKKSLFWYEKAATAGLVGAQFNLGLMYYYGIGTNVNKSLAMQWIHKSANSGFEPASSFLKSNKGMA